MRVLTLSVLLLARSAAAGTPHGVVGGLNLVFAKPAPSVDITTTAGNCYVNGVYVSFTRTVWHNPTHTLLLASIPYYCYVVNPAIPPAYVGCDPTPPTADGFPNPTVFGTANALFIGSFITNATPNIVPFYRNGEEVILKPENTAVGQPCSGAGYFMDFGAGVIFDNQIPHGVNCPNPLPWVTGIGGVAASAATPVPVASASALITDTEVAEGGAQTPGHVVYFLDPYGAKHAVFGVPGVTDVKDSEAQMINGSGLPGNAVKQYSSYRMRMNFLALNGSTKTATVYIGIDQCADGDTYLSIGYRGYVEPIVHIPVPSW